MARRGARRDNWTDEEVGVMVDVWTENGTSMAQDLWGDPTLFALSCVNRVLLSMGRFKLR